MTLNGWLWFALGAMLASAVAVFIAHAILARERPKYRRRPEAEPSRFPSEQ